MVYSNIEVRLSGGIGRYEDIIVESELDSFEMVAGVQDDVSDAPVLILLHAFKFTFTWICVIHSCLGVVWERSAFPCNVCGPWNVRWCIRVILLMMDFLSDNQGDDPRKNYDYSDD